MIYTTGHEIADTVAKFLPDGDYGMGYGILRGMADKLRSHEHWFEIDKGFWGARHYDGFYRLSYKGTQPIYHEMQTEPYDMVLADWRKSGHIILVCPPTEAVCEFFGIDGQAWLEAAIAAPGTYQIRPKGTDEPIQWDTIKSLITFNSSLAVEAVMRGLPTISDPIHSTVGSYTKYIKQFDGYDRQPLLSFIQSHQFRLGDKGKICSLTQHYQSKSTSVGIAGKL